MRYWEQLKDYWSAVRDDWDPGCKQKFMPVILHVMLPICFGALALSGGRAAFDSLIVSIVSVMTGLLFSMLVLLIELRGRVRRGEDKRAADGDRDTCNLDYAYYATNHTVTTGFILCGLLLVQGAFSGHMASWLVVASDWFLYALAAHFGIVALHCLKRLRRCYEVFGKGGL